MQNLRMYVFVFLSCIPSLLSISISPCAKWNTTGITVAGNGIEGSASDQLSYPQGIFIHDQSKRLYVSDSYNNRIQVLPLDHSTTTGITLVSRLQRGFKIYVDDDDDDFPTIYIAINGGNRVEKWTKNATHGVQVGGQCQACTGVWLDKNKNVYMSEHDRHRILKWSPLNNITTIVAGETDKKGPRADHLYEPQGIFVDKTADTLYVADLLNHRIQAWSKDAIRGITVAGSSDGDPGSDAATLDRPYGLRIDEETKTVYVVDLLNNRIQRWREGESEGETIVGGNGQGSASNQFYHPTDLAFDNQGNLYVSEGWNHRVQFFALIDNQPCNGSLTSTVSSTVTSLSTLTSTSTVSSFKGKLTIDLSSTLILPLIIIKLFVTSN